ncbi:TPA: hypothetical protein ACXGBB_005465 [Klebsiella pneumoniae]|nr:MULTISPECIES: hypothetical protein [Klebsiella]
MCSLLPRNISAGSGD